MGLCFFVLVLLGLVFCFLVFSGVFLFIGFMLYFVTLFLVFYCFLLIFLLVNLLLFFVFVGVFPFCAAMLFCPGCSGFCVCVWIGLLSGLCLFWESGVLSEAWCKCRVLLLGCGLWW